MTPSPALATLLFVVSLLVTFSAPAAPRPNLNCASNHILVRFKPEVRARLPGAAPTTQLSALLARI